MLTSNQSTVLFSAIRIFYSNGKKTLYLYEAERVFKDGQSVYRNLKTSIQGKLKDKEKFLKCARRIIKQKIGLTKAKLKKTNFIEEPENDEIKKIQFFDLYLEPDDYNPEGYSYEDENQKTFLKWKPVL